VCSVHCMRIQSRRNPCLTVVNGALLSVWVRTYCERTFVCMCVCIVYIINALRKWVSGSSAADTVYVLTFRYTRQWSTYIYFVEPQRTGKRVSGGRMNVYSRITERTLDGKLTAMVPSVVKNALNVALPIHTRAGA